jgi:hypothetical protein
MYCGLYWCVFTCKHFMIHTNTTTWSHRWYWYVLVHVFGMYLLVYLYIFYKYTLIHTITTGDLRAGSCVRTSRTKVPLGLLPAGDTGTISHSMHGLMSASYPGGECDKTDQLGTGSVLFYINSWPWPSDHPADWKPNLEHKAAAKTDAVVH